jgi:dihydroorotate dehydrogenase (NAD+) catalytic subunit
VAGASAVQIGTANFYNPTLATSLVGQLEGMLEELGARSVSEVVGTIKTAK